MRRRFCCRTTWLGLLLIALTPVSAWADDTPLAGAMPKDAFAYVEVSRLAEAYDQLASSAVWEKVRSSPGWDLAKQSPKYVRFQAGMRLAEMQLGTDSITALKGLLGNRVAIALYPSGKQEPHAVAVIRVADVNLLKRVKERLEAIVQLFAPEAFQNGQEIGGARIVAVQNKAFYLIRENTVAISSTKEMLETTAKLLAGEEAESLLQDPDYTQTMAGVSTEAIVRGYVNSGEVVAATKLAEKPRKMDNAVASLLFGGIVELGVHCKTMALEVDLQDDKLGLRVRLGAEPGKLDGVFGGYFNPADTADPVAVPNLPKVLGGFSIYRDFKSLYQQREQLMQEQTLPAFDKFETGLASLLPGKDFAQDVLSTLDNRMTFVVAEQSYDYLDGTPGVRLPGFAVIVDLAKPKEGSDLFRLLFQTVVAVSNFQAGSQGRQPMIMAAEERDGIQIQYGELMNRPSGDQLPIGLNFTPASALVGKRYIMSSSLELCRTLVDYLQSVKTTETRQTNFALALFPKAIANALESNRDLLQARLIQEGRTPERAQGEFSVFLDVLRYFDAIQLTNTVQPDSFDIRLEVSWK